MPTISVVMSVYNDVTNVQQSIDSILQQTFQDFEFIIINDGSTDGTREILDKAAFQDSRIRVTHQENTGLTQALIQGCKKAQGKFIARQDSGDISMPERLEKQVNFLKLNPYVSLVACSTIFVGPNNEVVFTKKQEGYELEHGLVLNLDKIYGPPHHGSTMFSRFDYDKVNGYRPDFIVAQDIDLWLRLVEIGRCFCLPDFLYKASLNAKSISANRRSDQIYFTDLAINDAHFRNENIVGHKYPKKYQKTFFWKRRLTISTKNNSIRESNFYYFLGSCIRETNPALAKKYFIHSLSQNPFNIKALIKMATTFLKRNN